MNQEFRQRCADAAMEAWSTHAVLCEHSQIIPVGSLVNAVLKVRDEELKRLQYELEQWHATYGESALPSTLARLRSAEEAVARARNLCSRSPLCIPTESSER